MKVSFRLIQRDQAIGRPDATIAVASASMAGLQEALAHWEQMTVADSNEIATRQLRLPLRNSAPPQRTGR